jgi:hypothetical protein
MRLSTVSQAGLLLAALNVSFGQHGRPAIWVTAHTAPVCRPEIAGPIIQQEVEGRLRAADIVVSRVHTVTLSADVNCATVRSAGRKRPQIAIQQCIDLSQRVPSQSRTTTLATIWRKCQSQTCSRDKCEAQAQAELGKLMDTFIADLSDLRIGYSPPSLAARSPVAPLPIPAAIAYRPPEKRTNAVVLYYVLYILACTAVLIRWEYIRTRAHY